MKVVLARNQSDFSAATSEIIAEGVSLADARAIIRAELGVAALRPERSWRAADHAVEAWACELDEECDDAYCVIE